MFVTLALLNNREGKQFECMLIKQKMLIIEFVLILGFFKNFNKSLDYTDLELSMFSVHVAVNAESLRLGKHFYA